VSLKLAGSSGGCSAIVAAGIGWKWKPAIDCTSVVANGTKTGRMSLGFIAPAGSECVRLANR
jgi:hypothetical protein